MVLSLFADISDSLFITRKLIRSIINISSRTIIFFCQRGIFIHKTLVWLLIGLDGVIEVKIERSLDSSPMKFSEEISRIWEQLFLPGITSPADTLPELVKTYFSVSSPTGRSP